MGSLILSEMHQTSAEFESLVDVRGNLVVRNMYILVVFLGNPRPLSVLSSIVNVEGSLVIECNAFLNLTFPNLQSK